MKCFFFVWLFISQYYTLIKAIIWFFFSVLMKLKTNENETNEHVALNFEILKYDPSESSGDILLDNSCDLNFHLTPTFKILTHHNLTWRISKLLRWWYIRKFVNFTSKHKESIKKNFETFKNFLSTLSYNSSIICFSETWLDEANNENPNYELPGYYSILQIRNNCKGCGVSIYIKKILNFKIQDDLSINCKDVESLCIELLFENKRSTLTNVL